MTDILIRDVPDDVVAALEARAARLGLSRAEYLKRKLASERTVGRSSVTVADLERLAKSCEDGLDPAVLRDAWA